MQASRQARKQVLRVAAALLLSGCSAVYENERVSVGVGLFGEVKTFRGTQVNASSSDSSHARLAATAGVFSPAPTAVKAGVVLAPEASKYLTERERTRQLEVQYNNRNGR